MSAYGKSKLYPNVPTAAPNPPCSDRSAFLNVCHETREHAFLQIIGFKCLVFIAALESNRQLRQVNDYFMTYVLPACLLVPALSPEIVDRFMPVLQFGFGIFLIYVDIGRTINGILEAEVVHRDLSLLLYYAYYYAFCVNDEGFEYVFDLYFVYFLMWHCLHEMYAAQSPLVVFKYCTQFVMLKVMAIEYLVLVNVAALVFLKVWNVETRRILVLYVGFALCLAFNYVPWMRRILEMVFDLD